METFFKEYLKIPDKDCTSKIFIGDLPLYQLNSDKFYSWLSVQKKQWYFLKEINFQEFKENRVFVIYMESINYYLANKLHESLNYYSFYLGAMINLFPA
jgi:hypothetical protein